MRDDILGHDEWYLTDTERSDLIAAGDNAPPKAADVVAELGMSLVAALGFALLVCSLLSAAGIPAPCPRWHPTMQSFGFLYSTGLAGTSNPYARRDTSSRELKEYRAMCDRVEFAPERNIDENAAHQRAVSIGGDVYLVARKAARERAKAA